MRSAMPWLWMSLTNKSLTATMHVDLRVVNVLSWRDLWAFKLLVWEVDALPLEREDTKTAWVAPASMMLPSGAELPKSLTDHQDRESWVQPVAFWMVGGCTPFPSHSTGMASTYLAPRSRNGDAKTGSFLFAKSQTDRSLVFPMRRTLDEETTYSVRRVWPTCERAFAWMLLEPGRWTGMSLMSFWLQKLRSRIIRQVSLNDLVPPSLIMYDTNHGVVAHQAHYMRLVLRQGHGYTQEHCLHLILMCWLACCLDHIPCSLWEPSCASICAWMHL